MRSKEFVTEAINPDCFNPAFNDTQIFDGLTYRATVEEEYGKPVLTVKVLDDNFQQAGLAKFKPSKAGVVSLITSFRPEYQGQGLARNIYAYVRALGNTIVPSRNQLPAGRAMWDAWKKSGDAKHLMRDVAEAKDLKKSVKIVKGPDAGKSGWIREIKHGLFKGAPKTYYIDLDGGGQANNLPATALRLVKDQGMAESNVFTDARMNAIKAGKDTFAVHGKTYQVTGDTSDEREAGLTENNHWHDAGVADAGRDVKRDPNRKVKTLNPRTRLKTLQYKQARHPEEVEQYSLGYRSINPAESICSLEEAHAIFDDFEQAMAERGLTEDAFDTVTDEQIVRETAAWRRKAGKSAKGGLNRKGVASYRRENPGSHLQMAVTTKPSKLKHGSKAAKRRKSFCARMSGVQGPMKKPNGKPTRKALALRKWNC